jgi:hypothetical protein
MIVAIPITPISDTVSRMRNGLRPPSPSTIAEKGIRKSEPVRLGIEMSSPAAAALSAVACCRYATVGPKSETAAKPIKNPTVDPSNPNRGLP